MMNFFEKAKNSMNKIKDEKGVPITVSENMLNELIKKTEKVKDTNIEISHGLLCVTGKAEIEKMFIKKDVSFMITLRPVRMEKRELFFEIVEFKPLNLDFIKKKLFNKQPFLTYKDSHITIDFNGWDIVRKVPFGNIIKYELTDKKITLTIGI